MVNQIPFFELLVLDPTLGCISKKKHNKTKNNKKGIENLVKRTTYGSGLTKIPLIGIYYITDVNWSRTFGKK